MKIKEFLIDTNKKMQKHHHTLKSLCEGVFFPKGRNVVQDMNTNKMYKLIDTIGLDDDEIIKRCKNVEKGNSIVWCNYNNDDYNYYKIESPIDEGDVLINTNRWSLWDIRLSNFLNDLRSGKVKVFIETNLYDEPSDVDSDFDSGDNYYESANNTITTEKEPYKIIFGKKYRQAIIDSSIDSGEFKDYLYSRQTIFVEDNGMAFIYKYIYDENSNYPVLKVENVVSKTEWNISLNGLLRDIIRGRIKVWLPAEIADKLNSKNNEFNDGSDLNESAVIYDDDIKDNIMMADGKKWYKTPYTSNSSDIIERLIPKHSLITISGSGIKLRLVEMSKPTYQGYALTSDYQLTFKIVNLERYGEKQIATLDHIVYNIKDKFVTVWLDSKAYIDVCGNKEILKKEKIPTGDEFNESSNKELKNLKGDDLETLKEGCSIVGKKKMVILDKKGNHYNVVSEGKKYKYSIDDLKYDYTHGKIKIFEDNFFDFEEDNRGGFAKQEEYGFPKNFFNMDSIYTFDGDLFFYIKRESLSALPGFKIVYIPDFIEKPKDKDEYDDVTVESIIADLPMLQNMYEDGRLKYVCSKQEYKNRNNPPEKIGDEFNEDL